MCGFSRTAYFYGAFGSAIDACPNAYFQPPAEGQTATEPWELGDPTNGQGFEAATALAIAAALGFSGDEVTWIPVPFNNAVQPGPKDFDLYLTQVSFSEERAQAVDLSDGYFDLVQSVVGNAGTPTGCLFATRIFASRSAALFLMSFSM